MRCRHLVGDHSPRHDHARAGVMVRQALTVIHIGSGLRMIGILDRLLKSWPSGPRTNASLQNAHPGQVRVYW